jgi:serine/threonine-protein kinase PknG
MTNATSACQRPGCAGHYAADGYCDECGYKAPAADTKASAGAKTSAGTKTSTGTKTSAGTKASAGKKTSAGKVPSARKATATGLTGRTGAGLGGTPSGSVVTGRSTRGRTGSRGGLGANVVMMAPIPLRDPTTAVMSDPQVPESQRFCGKCGEPVGRSHKGRPGLVEGFCGKDRTPYSFRPRLSPGELVDKRYEILGALAHGGLGWIYLARDRNISDSGADRWVVLKGLINTGDPDAMAAAMAERRFLVEVDHPNIVKIHDFAQQPDAKTGEMVGYIVMEYVGGRSLKDLALTHTDEDGRRSPLPLDQVLAYGIEVLPALGYLHDRGLLFCDFKPDNVIHAEEQLKVIDLGAVRRIDDHASALWGTPGYQAPELETRGASVASDIYTIGRTLAVLSFDFGGFSTRYKASLPDPGDVPLLAEQESYHRLLLRATHTDPAQRFGSAGEFAEQALGVLREVACTNDGVARPAASAQFTPQRRTFGAGSTLDGPTVAAALPLPLVDPTDAAAGFLATLGGNDPQETIAALASAPVGSVEVTYRLVRAHLDAGDTQAAAAALAAQPLATVAREPGDWRPDWYTGLIALTAGDLDEAEAAFDAVYAMVPGEPAAQLALAATDELSGDTDAAGQRYLRVWRVDHGYVSAAFGLARILLDGGDREEAVSILDEVPEVSSQYLAAQIAAVRASLDTTPGTLTEQDLVASSTRLERLRLDAGRRASLAVEMLRGALDWLAGTATAAPESWLRVVRPEPATPTTAATFLGGALREQDVRLGLERAYRLLASLEPDQKARYALVDQANAVRPRTVV